MPSNKYQTKQNAEKSDPQEQGFKQTIFQAMHCCLRSNESVHNVFYYVLMLIQFLQIFYYISHPFFPYYKSSIIMINIQNFLKYLVFNEFLLNDSNLYKILLLVILLYILIQIVLFAVVIKQIKEKKLINQPKKIHLISNIMFLVFNSILTIPLFGISLNVVYCDSQQNKYTIGQNCYQGEHIGYCFLAGFVFLQLLIQQAFNWYIYYNKNPFGTDFLSKYQNNAVIGKFLIKIIPVIYVSIDFKLSYIDVFAFAITACFCGYLFFFRIFAYHDYNEFNFYYVLFLEVILTWFSINNIILSYLDTEKKAGGLFQSFLCSLFVAALMIQIQQESYKKIFMEGMQSQKIKKQNVQKFLYRLIYMFTCSQSQNQKNHLQTVIKMLNSKLEICAIQQKGIQSKSNKKLQRKFYSFLAKFVNQYLESNSNVMLMAVNCNLLIFQQKFSYAFHQSLQLSNKKISLIEELMMYRFRRHPRYDKQKLDTTKKQNNNIFMMYYDFNQNLMRLQEQISACALNNLDYWEEVCEPNPSIYKIRNLAQKYEIHQQSIQNYYNKVYEIFPNNKLALKSYIEFLIYIGVNIKSLSKARQRYEQAQQNIKKTKQLQRDSGNLIQMGQNQNLAYISIQTSQLNLGMITNCNSQFKKMLGYQKYELIDKKVNKIMPKSFNQFHDNVVRNYIQKRQHNQKNKVQRVVYALNKDNYLVQVVLFTKVNYKTIGEKPGLQLIGFLKKIQDPNKALIILQINSSNIVGANAGFCKLIEDGISNSQFANSQIKICTLLPNLNQTFIQQGKSQQTCLIFSSSVIVTKSGLNLQVKKKVLIEVQQIRQYSNKIKLAYLVLKQIQSQQNSVKNDQRIRKATIQIIKTNLSNQNKNQVQVKNLNTRKVKVLSSQVSIMDQMTHSNTANSFEDQTLKLASCDKDQQVFTMIQRKKQQFLKNQHLDIFRYILWFTLVFFVLATMGVFIYQIILNIQLIDTSGQVKGQIMNSYAITYQTAQINKYVEKVMQGSSYNLTQFTENSNKLSTSISNFQSNFIPLMTMSVKYDFPLELNQFRYYDILIQKQAENPGYAQQTIIDAFFQYISSSKNYASYTMADVTVDAIHQLIQQNDFIQQNGKQLFPSVSKKMSYQYIDLGQYLYKIHQNRQIIITVSYGANLLIALGLIAILIRKINTFNETIVNLYNEIKLWDASEMKFKCIKFIQKNSANSSIKSFSKRRISSLLNLFPHDTLLKVLQTGNPNPNGQNKSSGHNLSQSGEQDQLLKSQNPQNEGIKQLSLSRAAQKQRKFYVILGQKNKLKKKFTIFISIASIFICLYFVKYVYSHEMERKTLSQHKQIGQVGRVRDNLAFINYYTYKLMIQPNNSDYRRLLKAQMGQFYKNTDDCYNLIEKSSSVLKDSYSLVQQINALIFSANLNISDSERYNIRNEKYLLQEILFQKNIKKLSQIIDKNIYQSSQTIYAEIKTFNFIFSLIYIMVTIIFALVIKCWMLEQILRNSKKSKSMILMLPPWLIERNKGILNAFQ